VVAGAVLHIRDIRRARAALVRACNDKRHDTAQRTRQNRNLLFLKKWQRSKKN